MYNPISCLHSSSLTLPDSNITVAFEEARDLDGDRHCMICFCHEVIPVVLGRERFGKLEKALVIGWLAPNMCSVRTDALSG